MKLILRIFKFFLKKQPKKNLSLDELQFKIGYVFSDQSLLNQAFTHPSFVAEHPGEGPSNQRLEFLGDGILGQIVSEYFFHRYEDKDEGFLSQKRSLLVRDSTLVDLSSKLGLGSYLKLGVGEARSGGNSRHSNLADAFEALLGAIYLDGGLVATKDFLDRFLFANGDQYLNPEIRKDYKSLLQEYVQQHQNMQPFYRIVSEYGPPHEKIFCVEVLIEKRVYGKGNGRSKKIAEKNAAKIAYEALSKNHTFSN
ncbi:MAG: ribonuclease III [Candidatus Cloacimonetes bacterium 4572_55]|nr:MAG: ribonuclease III [Candidatus Cloacimonetes bacterium 4572_55]